MVIGRRSVQRHRLRYTWLAAVSDVFFSSRTPRGRVLRLGTLWLGCALLMAASKNHGYEDAVRGVRVAAAPRGEDVERLFDRGLTWNQFLTAARAQREAWLKTTAAANL